MKYQQWSIPDLPAQAVDRLTGAGYPYLVSSVLASRGVTTRRPLPSWSGTGSCPIPRF